MPKYRVELHLMMTYICGSTKITRIFAKTLQLSIVMKGFTAAADSKYIMRNSSSEYWRRYQQKMSAKVIVEFVVEYDMI
jgi:hypothetical protein